MKPSSVVGELGWKGGLWCSPRAKTSSPISSDFFAMATAALMRSCSVGTRPVVGSGVTSPTEKMPSCMITPNDCGFNYLEHRGRIGYSCT